MTDLEAALQKSGSQSIPATNSAPAPMVATLVFRVGGIRGGGSMPPKNLDLASSVRRVSIVTELPADTPANEIVTAKLNSETIANGLRVRQDAEGQKSISFSAPASKLIDGRNQLTIVDSAGAVVGEFVVIANRKK